MPVEEQEEIIGEVASEIPTAMTAEEREEIVGELKCDTGPSMAPRIVKPNTTVSRSGNANVCERSQ